MIGEKRRDTRLAQDLSVRLYSPSAQVADGAVTVCDMSRGGLCLMTRSFLLDIGQTLDLSLALPNGSNLSGTALVRWSRSLGMANAHGLEFVNLNPFERRRLVKYLEPRHFGAMEALELAFQCAVAIAAVLVAREFVGILF